jgi:hypothetical protein
MANNPGTKPNEEKGYVPSTPPVGVPGKHAHQPSSPPPAPKPPPAPPKKDG